MKRFLSSFRIVLSVVIAMAAISSARAENALPSLDQALARALENHPDIAAAKAKVALAEAELHGKRMEVSRQVLGLYGGLKRLSAQIGASEAALRRAKTELERATQLAERGVVDQATKDQLATEVQVAESQLVQTVGQREQAEKELHLLIGAASPVAEAKLSAKAATAARQTPQGPIVDQMKAAGEKPIKLDFAETPLEEVMAILSDHAGVMFSIQGLALERFGLSADEPITLLTSEVRLNDALQAIEDEFPDLQFVLRDYGVLLTTRDYAQEHGYAPVLEFGKESADSFESR